jgi:hypothetical protein
MRLGPLGPLEIALIIAVIIIVVVLARILRTHPDKAQKEQESSSDTTIGSNGAGKNRLRLLLKRTGIALAAIGIVVLFASLDLFHLAFQGYLWSFFIVALGIALIYISRK